MKTIREQLKGQCQHFDGIPLGRNKDKKCDAGVSYFELMKIKELGECGCALRIPCTGRKAGTMEQDNEVQACDKYEEYTEEQIQERMREIEEMELCFEEGISICCKAPIDDSHVIESGEHKGHGPRFCSKCKKCVYMV